MMIFDVPINKNLESLILETTSRPELQSIQFDELIYDDWNSVVIKEVLPTKLTTFLDKITRSLDLDFESGVSTFLGNASAALGGNKRIIIHGTWYEKAILWIALVGTSGLGKSPLLKNTGWKIIIEWQSANFEQEKKTKKDHFEWEKLKPEDQKKVLEPVIKKAAIAYISHCTIEKHFEIHSHNRDGVSIILDELTSLLDGRNQYKGGRGSDQAKLLELWTGCTTFNPAGDEMRFIENPCVTVVGGLQTDLLQKIISFSSIVDGLASRFLYTFVKPSPAPTHDSIKAEIANSISSDEHKAITEIFKRFLDNRSITEYHKLDSVAFDRLMDYHHQLEINSRDCLEEMSSAIRKLKTYSARLSLLLHYIWNQSGDINLETVEKAILLTEYFRINTEIAYRKVFRTEKEKLKARIVDRVRRKGGGRLH